MQVEIDVSIKICPECGYWADELVKRLLSEVIPQCFDGYQMGAQIHISEILSAVLVTAGVHSARIVRFCRTGDGKPSNFVESPIRVARDEYPILGRLVVSVDEE